MYPLEFGVRNRHRAYLFPPAIHSFCCCSRCYSPPPILSALSSVLFLIFPSRGAPLAQGRPVNHSILAVLVEPRLPDPADSACFCCASIAVRLTAYSTSHSVSHAISTSRTTPEGQLLRHWPRMPLTYHPPAAPVLLPSTPLHPQTLSLATGFANHRPLIMLRDHR